MRSFVLLTRESSNRVYAESAPALLAAELGAIAPAMHCSIHNIEQLLLGGVAYVGFNADELDERDRFILSNLSGVRAAFEHAGGSLAPIDMTPLEWFGSDLITIQRYAGKTNEQFTHLLLNLALAASKSAHDRASSGETVRLLDPVAGRGSTLNRGLVYGFDVAGIEVNDADVDQYRTFLITYLKDHRVKHKMTKARIRNGELSGSATFDVVIRGDQRVRMARSTSSQARALYAGHTFDVIAGDLPYGVQHKATGKAASHRSPEDLVAESVSGWKAVLGKGGALGLAWNLRTMPRSNLVARVEDAGLHVVEHPRSFEHVVDRSITRDVLVATKP